MCLRAAGLGIGIGGKFGKGLGVEGEVFIEREHGSCTERDEEWWEPWPWGAVAIVGPPNDIWGPSAFVALLSSSLSSLLIFRILGI